MNTIGMAVVELVLLALLIGAVAVVVWLCVDELRTPLPTEPTVTDRGLSARAYMYCANPPAVGEEITFEDDGGSVTYVVESRSEGSATLRRKEQPS